MTPPKRRKSISDRVNDLFFHDRSHEPFEAQAIDLLKDIRLFLFLIFILALF